MTSWAAGDRQRDFLNWIFWFVVYQCTSFVCAASSAQHNCVLWDTSYAHSHAHNTAACCDMIHAPSRLHIIWADVEICICAVSSAQHNSRFRGLIFMHNETTCNTSHTRAVFRLSWRRASSTCWLHISFRLIAISYAWGHMHYSHAYDSHSAHTAAIGWPANWWCEA